MGEAPRRKLYQISITLNILPCLNWIDWLIDQSHLLKKVKSDAVSFRGVFLDVGIGPRLLTPELIAGETQNPQTRFSVLAAEEMRVFRM